MYVRVVLTLKLLIDSEFIDTAIFFLHAAAPVTEDMLVTHFLIQPDPEGVRLQGWNERPFSEAIPIKDIYYTDYLLL